MANPDAHPSLSSFILYLLLSHYSHPHDSACPYPYCCPNSNLTCTQVRLIHRSLRYLQRSILTLCVKWIPLLNLETRLSQVFTCRFPANNWPLNQRAIVEHCKNHWPTLHCLNPTMIVLSWPFHISTTSAHLLKLQWWEAHIFLNVDFAIEVNTYLSAHRQHHWKTTQIRVIIILFK